MKTFLCKTDGRKIELKNLGWLLRNWNQVSKLAFFYHPEKMNDGKLIAFLGNDRGDNDYYETDFASLSVCWNWLNRPVFKRIKFQLTISDLGISKEFTIGDTEWKRINKMEYKEQISYLINNNEK